MSKRAMNDRQREALARLAEAPSSDFAHCSAADQRSLHALWRRGYVQRRFCDQGAARFMFRITPAGREALRDI